MSDHKYRVDPDSALKRMREAQDRSFDCEGIPMFLALMSAGPTATPAPTDQQALAQGEQLAAELEAIRSVLFPTRREDDQGCLVTTVQTLTVGTFDPDRAE